MSHKPAEEFVQETLDNNYYTDDLAALYAKRWHPLFVYGTLKQGFSRNSLLNNSVYVGPGYTRGTGWAMYSTIQKHPYPIVLPVTKTLAPMGEELPTAGGVHGEVYLVSPKTMVNLDFIESNGIQYQRIQRLVDLPNVTTGQPNAVLLAFMYIGVMANWRPYLEHGDIQLCDHYTRKKNKNYGYYTFSTRTIENCVAQFATTPQSREARS
jgi:gamma-glutamylcyclotransferase (GGCT)/AIG2-like uncharacterized protein YtfP